MSTITTLDKPHLLAADAATAGDGKKSSIRRGEDFIFTFAAHNGGMEARVMSHTNLEKAHLLAANAATAGDGKKSSIRRGEDFIFTFAAHNGGMEDFNMNTNDWKFAISSADEAPATAPILLQGSVEHNLRTAAQLGYNAIEIHTREDAELDYEAIRNASACYGVNVAAVVTGRLNTEGKCSLMADEPYIVSATMDGMRQYIDMAQKLDADLVIGWVKGNIPAGGKREKYMARLAKNLQILNDYGKGRGVRLNIEVINRYEVNVFTTANELMSFLETYPLDNCYAHLDTFHMGVDECDPVAAIRRCGDRLGYFHLADNSRRYPGSGQFDFKKILKALDEISYAGYLSVECFPYPNAELAATRAITHLRSDLLAIGASPRATA